MRAFFALALLLLAAPATAQEKKPADGCRNMAKYIDRADRQIARYQGSEKQKAYANSLTERAETIRQGFVDGCLLPRPCYAFHWSQGEGKGYVQSWEEVKKSCPDGE